MNVLSLVRNEIIAIQRPHDVTTPLYSDSPLMPAIRGLQVHDRELQTFKIPKYGTECGARSAGQTI
ncbi:hypothetical protein VP1G_11311 [Cytospora mali]|uniref:Uncharacterized protein n=1 Tax=Cytospora mali TaxID=578113 RepID=A0A194VB30_CYTMA|nr:hypothetical protein VP1G_11311 [Valsa mali var. pyri (nom. inval.)]